MATSYEELIAAKKEAVGLQLEAAYRARLQDAYTQVRTVFRFHVKNIGAQCTCGKTRNSLSPNFFRQINSLVTYLVTPLLSRNFCQKCVRENSRDFHTVKSE